MTKIDIYIYMETCSELADNIFPHCVSAHIFN